MVHGTHAGERGGRRGGGGGGGGGGGEQLHVYVGLRGDIISQDTLTGQTVYHS